MILDPHAGPPTTPCDPGGVRDVNPAWSCARLGCSCGSVPLERFVCLDLETNGLDVRACEVAQVAVTSAPASQDGRPAIAESETSAVYCGVSEMPAEASAINGLTMEMLEDQPPFMARVKAVASAWVRPGVVGVTFNGERFDLAVLARYAAGHGGLSDLLAGQETDPSASAVECYAQLLSSNHVDVARVWQVLRKRELVPWWQQGLSLTTTNEGDETDWSGCVRLHSGMFGGSLAAAYGFYCGCGFDGAHDAEVDTRATLAVLDAMLAAKHVTLAEALAWTSGPVPGDVDAGGVFVWRGDRAVCRHRKFAGAPIEDVDHGYLRWLLDQDFHWHTKKVVRAYLAGRYPERREDEANA